jgi:hypothetical protein
MQYLQNQNKKMKVNIVAYLLKARSMEPEKESLLVNGSETTFISRQWPQNKVRL